jgi:hypothetical protein
VTFRTREVPPGVTGSDAEAPGQPCNRISPDEDIELKVDVELISANTQLMECYLR